MQWCFKRETHFEVSSCKIICPNVNSEMTSECHYTTLINRSNFYHLTQYSLPLSPNGIFHGTATERNRRGYTQGQNLLTSMTSSVDKIELIAISERDTPRYCDRTE